MTVLSNARVDELTPMKFLIHPNRMTLRRSWVIWAVTSKSLVLMKLLGR